MKIHNSESSQTSPKSNKTMLPGQMVIVEDQKWVHSDFHNCKEANSVTIFSWIRTINSIHHQTSKIDIQIFKKELVPDTMRRLIIGPIDVVELNFIRNLCMAQYLSGLISPFQEFQIERQRNFFSIISNLQRRINEFYSWRSTSKEMKQQ